MSVFGVRLVSSFSAGMRL